MNLMGQDKSPQDYATKEKVTISVTAQHMCYTDMHVCYQLVKQHQNMLPDWCTSRNILKRKDTVYNQQKGRTPNTTDFLKEHVDQFKHKR